MEKEIRNFGTIDSTKESRHIEGYALVFDTESRDLGGFTEKIDKDALDGLIEKSDVFCLLNHDESRGVLARSNMGEGSLKLEVDERGLKYSFDAPNTALGDELLEAIKRKDITSSSFGFRCKEDKWEKRSDGSYLRTIKKFDKLFDVSPVYQPAYSETSVDTRGLDELKKEENKEILDYYSELEKKIK